MWTGLRAWWYLSIEKKKPLPPDVKEYVFRRANRMASKQRNISPEEKLKLSELQYMAAVTAKPGEISEEFRSTLIVESFNRLGEVPCEKCEKCGRPVFTHQAVKIAEKHYCPSCAGQPS